MSKFFLNFLEFFCNDLSSMKQLVQLQLTISQLLTHLLKMFLFSRYGIFLLTLAAGFLAQLGLFLPGCSNFLLVSGNMLLQLGGLTLLLTHERLLLG